MSSFFLSRRRARGIIGPMAALEPLLTKKDVMSYLRISHTTLWKMIRDHGLPHYRVGRELRFKANEIDRWLESGPPARPKSRRRQPAA